MCDAVVEDGELEKAAAEIRGLGRKALAMKADVTRKDEVDAFIEKAVATLGEIDVLVNNAGVAGGPPLIDQTPEDFQRTMDINLKGVYLFAQAVGKRMVARKKGSIINIASGAAIRGFATRNAYNISKAGVVMLTKVMARDLARYGVRVNAIAPTNLRSEMTRAMWSNPQVLKAEESRIPIGRLAEVQDILGPALLLATDASAYITGDTIVVDGGQLA
jgi:NAD(P)-dependent dehydrogenase (short-subunit alcohol dehydrogenase family)